MTIAANFRQADVTRLIKGVVAGGIDPYSIRLTVTPDGSLCVAIKPPSDIPEPVEGGRNEWNA